MMNFKTSIGIALLLTQSAWSQSTTLAGPQTASYDYLPGVSIVLGQGFSLKSALSSPSICIVNPTSILDPNRLVSQNSHIEELVVTSSRALKTVLGIDTQMDASILSYSGGGSFSFNSEVDISENDATVVIQGDAEYNPDILNLQNLKYRPDVQGLIDAGDIPGFHRTCGDNLITSVKRGTRVSIVLSIRGMSRQEKLDVNSSASISGSFGPLSGSAKNHINALLQSSSSTAEVKVQVFVRGGDGLPNLDSLVNALLLNGTSLQQFTTGISELLKALPGDKAAAIGFTTQPYPGVDSESENVNDIMKTNALSILTDDFRSQDSRYERLSSDFNSQQMTGIIPDDFSNIVSGLLDNANQEMPLLQQYVQLLAQAHEKCFLSKPDQIATSCVVPKRPSMPFIDVLYAKIIRQ